MFATLDNSLLKFQGQFFQPTKQSSGQNAQKKNLRKKYREHLLGSFQRTKSSQTRELVSPNRSELVKKTNFNLELTKILDRFVISDSSYTTNLITF